MNGPRFQKTWGAEPLPGGAWRFRLWAPGLAAMELVLDGRRHDMARSADGWFAIELPAEAGQSYGFAPPDGPVVPDPAARAQRGDVHGPSVLVDPRRHDWQVDWRGRPWEEAVIYELHVGTFSDTHDFDGVRRRLDHLVDIGITAIELCPVAQFGGTRGWGYDGVLHYAPHPAYGGPDGLKRLVDAAHKRNLMVLLDVVYNHFGPDGNYIHVYAPEFFDPARATPWGAAIAYDRAPVRQFFVENALYWLSEYRMDGLRLDAVDQIVDRSEPPLLEEIARAVRGAGLGRPVHLTTEDDRNVPVFLERDRDNRPILYDGEWNDDFHHVAHVLATGECDGYYADYADDPRGDLAIALTQGYVQQGRASGYRNGAARGEPSAHLPPTAFVNCLQNHDQTGNRAFGERLSVLAPSEAVEVMTAVLLLAPMTPMLFMGEEWGETRPFQFFCDFDGDLADAVRNGRRREFARWPQFADPAFRETIPDPNARETFARCVLDWDAAQLPEGRKRLDLVRTLTRLRAAEIAPRLPAMRSMAAASDPAADRGLMITWTLGDGARLLMDVNLGGSAFKGRDAGRQLFRLRDTARDGWSIRVAIEDPTS